MEDGRNEARKAAMGSHPNRYHNSPNDTVLLVAVLPIPDQATGGESRCNEASNLLSDPGSFFLPCNPAWSELSVGGGARSIFEDAEAGFPLPSDFPSLSPSFGRPRDTSAVNYCSIISTVVLFENIGLLVVTGNYLAKTHPRILIPIIQPRPYAKSGNIVKRSPPRQQFW